MCILGTSSPLSLVQGLHCVVSLALIFHPFSIQPCTLLEGLKSDSMRRQHKSLAPPEWHLLQRGRALLIEAGSKFPLTQFSNLNSEVAVYCTCLFKVCTMVVAISSLHVQQGEAP